MKLSGKAQEVGERIIHSFETGEIPAAAAQIFVQAPHLPCSNWSYLNRLMTVFSGTSDARGFQQWKDAGRCVKKGAKCFYILGPTMAKSKTVCDESDKPNMVLVGFHTIPVFRFEDTEIIDPEKWAETEKMNEANKAFTQSLPLIDVARSWGIHVETYEGKGARALGWFRSDGIIALGTKNLSTWAHEMIHAADHRLGELCESSKMRAEVVAELGGAILLSFLGMNEAADLGGCYEYVCRFADGDHNKAIHTAMKYLNAACECVELVISEAVKLSVSMSDAA